MLDRDEDIKSTGMRSPYLAKYKVIQLPQHIFLNNNKHLKIKCNEIGPGLILTQNKRC